jgi:hypothetical protein
MMTKSCARRENIFAKPQGDRRPRRAARSKQKGRLLAGLFP